MKYCHRCGTELTDESAYCNKCGAWQYVETQQDTSYQQANSNQPQKKEYKHQKVFEVINKVLMIYYCAQFAGVVLCAILFTVMAIAMPDAWPATMYAIILWGCSIPLAWMVPMIVHYFKKTRAGEPTTLTFKICTLLFVNLLAGIFMLCFEPSADNTTKDNGGQI